MNEIIISLSKSLIDLSLYKDVKKIGAGSFGKVYLMEEPTLKVLFAIKFMRGGFKDHRSKILFMREIETQLACADKRVTAFRGYYLPDANPSVKRLRFPALILEYLPNGSLQDYLAIPAKQSLLSPTMKSKILFGTAIRIRHMHRKNVIHRDLKPDNILLDDSFNPRIADFGLARLINEEEEGHMTMEQGTMTYMAPEVIESDSYNKKADVYSFGMLTYYLMTGEEPFKDVGYYKLMAFVKSGDRPDIPETMPDYLVALLEQCWSQDPEERPDFEKIIEVMTLFDCVLEGTDMDDYNEYRKLLCDEFELDNFL